MGRFAAVGGGTYEEMDVLTRRIADLSGKERPNVLFVGTALQDSTNPLTSCRKSFKRVCPGCIVKKLSIIRTVYTDAEIDALLSWADVIFVGGGNTAYMLDAWRARGLDRKLKAVFDSDSAVLSGLSAGAICWFEKGYTDSESFEGKEDWSYAVIEPGINLYPAFFCPHYGDWGRRGFDDRVKETGLPGIALEDGTMMVYDRGQVSFYRADARRQAYLFTSEGPDFKKSVW
ncbi:MAG: Type 1 glutamine amidotransferase-like domain-containing protein [Lachnospiraceae bacterium]|nr:Type 1 glutamine amidotransferase-like domain-containing protein [Lachnospiraceae bacterium]